MTVERREWTRRGSLGGLFLLLAILTWQRSGDPLVDWGREIYGAYSVAQGDGIPIDILTLFGALSPLINGAALRIGGVGLTTILILNLLILSGVATLIYWISTRAFGRDAAVHCTIAWMFLSGFPHLVRIGNYNFLTPYSHGITHGFLFSLMVVALLHKAIREGGLAYWFLAGAGTGLAVCAKPEAGVAAIATLTGAFVLAALAFSSTSRRSILAAFMGTIMSISAVSLMANVGRGVSINVIVDPYLSAVRTLRSDFPFYVGPWAATSLLKTILMGIAISIAIATVAVVSERLPANGGRSRPSSAVGQSRLAAVLGAILLFLFSTLLAPFAWTRLALCLPWIALAALIWSVASLFSICSAAEDDRRHTLALRGLFALFSLTWLLKTGFDARFDHYGFALSGPAIVLGIGLSNSDSWYGSGGPGVPRLRQEILGPILTVFLLLSAGSQSVTFYLKRTDSLGTGRDRMFVFSPDFDSRMEGFRRLLNDLRGSAGFHAGSVIIPEGGMVHYLLRTPSSIPMASLMPLEVALVGADRVVDMLETGRPELIVRAEPDPIDWLSAADPTVQPHNVVTSWIESNYCPTGGFGGEDNDIEGLGVQYFSRCQAQSPGR